MRKKMIKNTENLTFFACSKQKSPHIEVKGKY